MTANARNQRDAPPLRRGWTTGACATAALKAALNGLWGGKIPARVQITLPKGETPEFTITHARLGSDWAEAGVIKDAGDDPDVTHGVSVMVRVSEADGVTFHAGQGVGTVTKPGLPIPPGDPAINPVPRAMMEEEVATAAILYDRHPGAAITVSIPGGAEIAQRTWNPRLGIIGGLSILGTTGIVRPFSCAAWIASIHRGVDVARAGGLAHVAGCTGNMSERAVQQFFGLPDHAMLDMGDFAGGMIKYLRRHPVARVSIGGGAAKLTKLAQGAVDLHSGRSQVDFTQLADWAEMPELAQCNTVLEALMRSGPRLGQIIADKAVDAAWRLFDDQPPQRLDLIVTDRGGAILATARRSRL